MFKFNLRLNKYVIKPIHIVWTSILPRPAVDHIQMAYNNIEYPKRLVSTLVQKDFKHSRSETARFFRNLTLGLAGLFDPAENKFGIKGVNEDMEQALAKRHMRQGHYLILPVITPTNTRNITGSILDTALNPSTYLFFSGFIVSGIKAGILINRTSRYQSLAKMIESSYADPYDMAKKIYGVEKYILIENYDRKEVLKEIQDSIKEEEYGIVNVADIKNFELEPDITLENYNPQGPVTDSLRTSLFTKPEAYKSIWYETSCWNRSFNKRIKTGSVKVTENKPPYQYRYILQKDKTSPLAIIYPSIGEGRTSSHSVVYGKIFYDKGYSVVILGSPFQWEFVKSMPDGYKPGNPQDDIKHLRETTSLILAQLEQKYKKNFDTKVVLGTSLGALMTLELANEEAKENTMNITKYIAICPPLDLLYAIKQFDKNSEEWTKFSDDLQKQIAFTAAKAAGAFVGKIIQEKDISDLRFSEDEAKLITGFIMHQKLSDLIYTIENTKDTNPQDLYKMINNMNYQDYAEKYLSSQIDTTEDFTIFHLSDYLKNNDNYIIYHSADDYLSNSNDMKKLKSITGNKMILISNGSHLGFTYRKEFQDDLENEIPVSDKLTK